MGLNIIEKINKDADTLTKEDINSWVIDEVVEHLRPRLEALSRYAYGISDVGRRAFIEWSRPILSNALEVYILKKQHWKTRDDITPYLIKVVKTSCIQDKSEIDANVKANVPVCPACKSRGYKNYLVPDGKNWRCHVCADAQSLFEGKDAEEATFRGIFAIHSRKGYRCPDCKCFIPHSYVGDKYSLSCPYNNCTWFGVFNEIEPMAHPTSVGNRFSYSLNDNIRGGSKCYEKTGTNDTYIDRLKDRSAGAFTKLAVTQQYEQELRVIEEVIIAQMQVINRDPKIRAIKKQLMYQAYKNMLDKSPEDMVMYLAHQKHPTDSPIQARIFQEFVRLVQDELPFDVQRRGTVNEICSLLDHDLDLFLGLTDFDAEVMEDGFVPNKTKETYVGGREAKDFGPCFIGFLCDVYYEDSTSIMDKVDYYTFSHIKLKDVPVGTKIGVRHMYMPSHYEMNGLVPLQRIRRKIVDSVYLRLYGKKRKVNRKNAKDQGSCKISLG